MKVMLDPGSYLPERAFATDAGLDLRSPVDAWVPAHGSIVIDTGVHMEIPVGYVGMLKSKSGLNVKHGITSEGVVDAGYVGSIIAKLYNNADKAYVIAKGDKITQIVILPILAPEIEVVDHLDKTERNCNGFGSTGR